MEKYFYKLKALTIQISSEDKSTVFSGEVFCCQDEVFMIRTTVPTFLKISTG